MPAFPSTDEGPSVRGGGEDPMPSPQFWALDPPGSFHVRNRYAQKTRLTQVQQGRSTMWCVYVTYV